MMNPTETIALLIRATICLQSNFQRRVGRHSRNEASDTYAAIELLQHLMTDISRNA